jgi:hypothetical protein
MGLRLSNTTDVILEDVRISAYPSSKNWRKAVGRA